MIARTIRGFHAALFAGVFALSCSGAPGDSADATGTASVSPDTQKLGAVKSALSTLTLSPGQRAKVDALVTAASLRREAMKDARLSLQASAAEALESNTFDPTRLAPAVAKLSVARADMRNADLAALEELHEILEPSQRGQFVDALTVRLAELHGHRGHGHHGKLEAWASELGLSDAQREQIRSVLKPAFTGSGAEATTEWSTKRAAGLAMLESFREEHFVVADSVKQSVTGSGTPREQRLLDALTLVAPTLTAAQRTMAATRIRAEDAVQ